MAKQRRAPRSPGTTRRGFAFFGVRLFGAQLSTTRVTVHRLRLCAIGHRGFFHGHST